MCYNNLEENSVVLLLFFAERGKEEVIVKKSGFLKYGRHLLEKEVPFLDYTILNNIVTEAFEKEGETLEFFLQGDFLMR